MKETTPIEELNEKILKNLNSKLKKIKKLKGKRFGRLKVQGWSGKVRVTESQNKANPLVTCLCDCGRTKDVSYESLIKGGTNSCGCINAEIQQEKAYREGMIINQWELISFDHNGKEDAKNPSVYWLCKCTCGCDEEKVINLRRAHWTFCSKRKIQNQEELMEKKEAKEINPTPSNVKDLTGMQFGELEVLGFSFKHVNGNKYWVCECSCGNIECYYDRCLLEGYTQSCGCRGSRGEAEIKRVLIEHNISYVAQYSYERCKDKNILRFDFKIHYPNSDEYFLCEFQGEQHYVPVRWSTNWTEEQTMENFRNTQRKDRMKREFCKNNNIDLLEIKYIDYYEIEDLILEQIENHNKNN